MAQSLAVKYRPGLEDVVGQDIIVKILKKQVEDNKLSHCYLFAGSSGCGKAQPLTSLVLTKTGYISMAEVDVGSKILDGNGVETTVTQVFPQGMRNVYKISFTDGSSIEVADNHLNRVIYHNPDTNKDEYSDLTTLELIKNIELSGGLKKYQVPVPILDCWSGIEIKKNPIDLFEELSIEDSIPLEYIYNVTPIRQETLSAALKKYHEDNNSIHINRYSKIKDDIMFIARSLGYVVTEEKSPKYTYDNILKFEKNGKRYIKSIDYLKRVDCKCIYVESNDHTYITDNITVTHNTTIARGFAKLINKGKGTPIEIDAASNNGVDAVRDIVDQAKERSIDSEYKIFIIDETHALSNQAWQAFLKCIEEPPEYTIFMFCTTNPEKIPATINNRLMRFNISKISSELIRKRLQYVCEQEGFTNYNEACDYLSKVSNGGMRDALALLEKCANYSTDLDIKNVLDCLGNFSYDSLFNFTGAILNQDEGQILKMIDDYYNSGNDLKMFTETYLEFTLDLAKYCLFKDMKSLKIPTSLESRCAGYATIPNILDYTNKLVDKVLDIKNAIKYDVNNKTTVEAMFINICRNM